ncbi:MAG: hypothetical protein JWN28_411 [Candidatus Saccharibacteria bacterium]|nr:hypothetical protein [Candidatus Saccharibacteria bacterium]
MGTRRYIANTKKISSGFTIVELLIVVVVIAILASITIIAFSGITQRAAQASLQASIKQAATLIDIYKVDNGTYPASLNALNSNQSLYGNTSNLWAYSSAAESYCISIGSSSSSATYHISEANGIMSGLCAEHTVGMLSNETTTYPTRGGYTDVSSATAATPANNTAVLIGSVPVGSWMIIVYANSINSGPTPPAGWTTLMPRHTANSLYTSIFAKIKQPGDANQQLFDAVGASGETLVNAVLLWGGNSAAVSTWNIGTIGDRASNASSTTTVTPTVTTTIAKSLVLSIGTERTIANETNYTSLIGVTPWIWIPQISSNRNQTITIGYEEKQTPGVSQAMTVTYPNSQATNGTGVQIVIPPAS